MIVKASDFLAYLSKTGPDYHGYDQVIVPVQSTNTDKKELIFDHLQSNRTVELDTMRTTDPLKYLFYLPRETVYPAEYPTVRRIIAGVKSCDLKSLNVLDQALLFDGFVDPAFNHWRKNTLIISSDCTVPAPACHCTLVGGKPHAEFGYDLNISLLDKNYYILIGSDAGKAFMEQMIQHINVSEASHDIKEQIQTNRHKMTRLIEQLNESYPRRNGYHGILESEMVEWKELSKDCIGCGACTHICPSCYCLILNDESNGNGFSKVRSMDSCQYHGYARVAGGGSPRPHMHQRFRNRYLCKFINMKENFDTIGCSGCGRCVEACAARIDFRKVVENVTTVEVV